MSRPHRAPILPQEFKPAQPARAAGFRRESPSRALQPAGACCVFWPVAPRSPRQPAYRYAIGRIVRLLLQLVLVSVAPSAFPAQPRQCDSRPRPWPERSRRIARPIRQLKRRYRPRWQPGRHPQGGAATSCRIAGAHVSSRVRRSVGWRLPHPPLESRRIYPAPPRQDVMQAACLPVPPFGQHE